MLLGFAAMAIGYSIFYWGLHHFPSCLESTCSGKTQPCQRYSLWTLLGVTTLSKNLISYNPPTPIQFQ